MARRTYEESITYCPPTEAVGFVGRAASERAGDLPGKLATLLDGIDLSTVRRRTRYARPA